VSLPDADAAPEASPAAAANSGPSSVSEAVPVDAMAAAASDVAAADPAAADAAPGEAAVAASADPATRAAQEDCGPQLKKLYPALFSNPPKPLKLRIQADIQARSPGVFTKPQLSAFLRRYTGSHAYLNALVKATHRFDLDGNPGDELSDEHRNAANEELARRRANTQARIALEIEQRANRATLLKEFEANTLPAAEFAASRGIPEAELEPLIARARKEALEPPSASGKPAQCASAARGERDAGRRWRRAAGRRAASAARRCGPRPAWPAHGCPARPARRSPARSARRRGAGGTPARSARRAAWSAPRRPAQRPAPRQPRPARRRSAWPAFRRAARSAPRRRTPSAASRRGARAASERRVDASRPDGDGARLQRARVAEDEEVS
jgi:sRNA-binding protein